MQISILKYKPWTNNSNNAWNSEEPSDQTYINAWHEYLSSPEAVLHVPNWEEKLHDAIQNAEEDNTDNVTVVEDETSREEWMILASTLLMVLPMLPLHLLIPMTGIVMPLNTQTDK